MSTAELSLNGLGCRLQICRRLAGVGVRFSLIGGLFAPRVSVCTRPPAPLLGPVSQSHSGAHTSTLSLRAHTLRLRRRGEDHLDLLRGEDALAAFLAAAVSSSVSVQRSDQVG